MQMTSIMRGADTFQSDLTPQSAGVANGALDAIYLAGGLSALRIADHPVAPGLLGRIHGLVGPLDHVGR
jgi:hypothetical protein